MGSSMNVYVGPVVILKLDPLPYTETYNSCPNDQCLNEERSDQKFCYDCGAQIAPVTFKRVGVRGWNNFVESGEYKWEDVLYNPEYLGDDVTEILLSNTRSGNYVEADGGFMSLTDNEKIERVAAYVDANKELICEMKDFFGNNLSLDYGVAAFWA